MKSIQTRLYFEVYCFVNFNLFSKQLIRDHGTKESRGFAFITFEKIESGSNAFMLNVSYPKSFLENFFFYFS